MKVLIFVYVKRHSGDIGRVRLGGSRERTWPEGNERVKGDEIQKGSIVSLLKKF